MPVCIAPKGWDHEAANPFTVDGSYGRAWSCFRVLDRADDQYVIRGLSHGLHCFLAGRCVPDIEERLGDFLAYEDAHGRSTIVSFPPDVDAATYVARCTCGVPAPKVVRDSDPRWVVHSTSLVAWTSIERDGELRSLATLRAAGLDAGGVGFREFSEPDDYADYVMLSRIERIGPEHVVASMALGWILTDEAQPYSPGVQLYFDAHRLITDGLVTRDGVHLMKVHQHLPLNPYLVATITAADVDPAGQVESWTPRTFLNAANAAFAALPAVGAHSRKTT